MCQDTCQPATLQASDRKEKRAKNHSEELIFHSQGLRRSAANLVGSHRRIRLREILLACLSALRFDMEEV